MAFEPSRLASFDRETLLGEIKRVIQQLGLGRAPSHKEFNRLSRVHSSTIAKRFGNWEAAMRAAGADYARSRKTISDLEGDLRRVLKASGGQYFTENFYVQTGGRFNWTTLKKRLHCTNWAELLEKVLHVRPSPRVIVRRVRVRRPSAPGARTRLTPESLLSELRSTAARSSSQVLSYAEYRALGGRYSIGAFQKHIGQWRDAVSLIGRTDGHAHPRPHLTFTNEDYFAEIQRAWEILGRQPKSREMKQCGSKMSHQAFQVRFGSWMRAIHAFCEDRGTIDGRSESPTQVGSRETGSDPRPPSSVVHERREIGGTGVRLIQKTTPRAPSLKLRFKVFQRDRFTCRACGRSPATEIGVVLHVDHVIPYSGSGETTLDNMQTLCEPCNLGKSDSLAGSQDVDDRRGGG
jgi:hypothetical protein